MFFLSLIEPVLLCHCVCHPGLLIEKKDSSLRDVRRAPKLWAQDEKGWGGRKAKTPGPLLTSFDQSAEFDDVAHWQKSQITC